MTANVIWMQWRCQDLILRIEIVAAVYYSFTNAGIHSPAIRLSHANRGEFGDILVRCTQRCEPDLL